MPRRNKKMKYTKNDVITVLEESGLIVPINTEYYRFNSSMIKHLAPRKNIRCIDYPEDFIGLSDNIIYNKVMDNADIPTMFKGDSIKYYLRTKSTAAVKILKAILASSEIDYNQFTENTRGYYSNKAAVKSFSNYLISGDWEMVYKVKDELISDKGER